MTLSTKDYNKLVATVDLGLPLDDSTVPPSPDRDAMYADLVAAKASGDGYGTVSD